MSAGLFGSIHKVAIFNDTHPKVTMNRRMFYTFFEFEFYIKNTYVSHVPVSNLLCSNSPQTLYKKQRRPFKKAFVHHAAHTKTALPTSGQANQKRSEARPANSKKSEWKNKKASRAVREYALYRLCQKEGINAVDIQSSAVYVAEC